jgi:hypothetical protein
LVRHPKHVCVLVWVEESTNHLNKVGSPYQLQRWSSWL